MARLAFVLIILIGIFSCESERQIREIQEVVAQMQSEYAPDARTAIFDIEVSHSEGYILSGETNLPDAKSSMLDRLSAQGYSIRDQIIVLPDAELGQEKVGIVNVSVANLRAAPQHSAELVTQALLGMPMTLLKKQGGWYLVQSPDNYIAWTNSGALQLMNRQEFNDWKNSEKVIYLETYGFAENGEGARVSDLVAGNVFTYSDKSDDYWEVMYPDGRLGRIKSNEAADLQTWSEGSRISDSSIAAASRQMMGVPYLWGGTSTKGLDCSGFTKTVYLLHGLVLPRDASQQVHSGVLVDTTKNFSLLETGDLLFFGRVNEDGSERVVHVGLWLGNNQFIHASGDVHISSMDSLDANYDAYNYNRYLRTKRIVGVEDESIRVATDIY